MRLTDFWDRMDEVFGPAYARSWAHDVVLPEFGGTVEEAIANGQPAKDVWRAVCRQADVPAGLR